MMFDNTTKIRAVAEKEQVEQLKAEWKRMWAERFNDKSKAEGVSTSDYHSLFVEQGTVLHATRDFKSLNFKDILEQSKIQQPERYIQPSPSIGGWNKFIKTTVTKKPHKQQRALPTEKTVTKSGRKAGWLHL